MRELLESLFALVCGQNPEHIWAPGGQTLPLCQRCSGLYVGSAVAVVLWLFFRPLPGARFLKLHGAFLLLMVPFGFHWVEQGPVLRTLTGHCFGFGLVAFLLLSCSTIEKGLLPKPGSQSAYWLGCFVTCAATPFSALFGGRISALLLTTAATLGLLILAGLAIGNLGLLARASLRPLRRRNTSPAGNT